jgi:2-(1,2-epoxy-1,2-dihydrophenyl)acetyl-CoA isomerase
MNYQTISVDSKDNVGFLYLNRPQVLNALSEEMRAELLDFLPRAAADDGLRVLVVTGKGRAFSAGGDLRMFKSRYEAYRRDGSSGTFANVDLPEAFSRFPKPMIAAVNGPAVGFGATMPLTCDVRIASAQAQFSFAFVRLGLTPEFGSSYHLPRLIGYGKAAELVFSARTIDAQEALRIGLVNRVVAAEELLPEAGKMAAEIARMPADAVRAAKRALRHGSHSTLEQVLAFEALTFQSAAQTPEHYAEVCRKLDQLKQDGPRPGGGRSGAAGS